MNCITMSHWAQIENKNTQNKHHLVVNEVILQDLYTMMALQNKQKNHQNPAQK